jgi:membrane-bound lytic murein transglycosylase MltF
MVGSEVGARTHQREARTLTTTTTTRPRGDHDSHNAQGAQGAQAAHKLPSASLKRLLSIGLSVFGLLIAIQGCEAESTSTIAPEVEPEVDVEVEAVTSGVSKPLADEIVRSTVTRAGDRYPASLETVIEKRYLRVLTSRNAFDFFIHDGQRGGYQYEMVRAFTQFLNERHAQDRKELAIEFELIPVDDDQLIPLLLAGAGDLIAARLTITPERAELVRFSEPYRRVDELVVTHDGTTALDSIESLSGRTVAIRKSSSYSESLSKLNRQLTDSGLDSINLVFVDERLATERILDLVAARRFDYTVADSIVAEMTAQINSQLRIVPDITLRRDGQLAWATMLSAGSLAEETNSFLRRYKQGTLLGNIAVRKFFEAESKLAERFASNPDTNLSDYDDLFREHAATFDLDWRLAASMAYQESRFDPTARNRWGAIGLLQIKLATAREPYVNIPDIEGAEHVSENVRAGLKYLNWIKARYFDSEPEMLEPDRMRMALAAYNAGPRHVIRARSLALQLGLDPNRWFRHVELAMLDLRKTEPVKYVSDINQRYLAYLILGVE